MGLLSSLCMVSLRTSEECRNKHYPFGAAQPEVFWCAGTDGQQLMQQDGTHRIVQTLLEERIQQYHADYENTKQQLQQQLQQSLQEKQLLSQQVQQLQQQVMEYQQASANSFCSRHAVADAKQGIFVSSLGRFTFWAGLN